MPPLWNPAATRLRRRVELSQELMPLAAFKKWLTVVSGLKNKIGNASPHPMGSAASTTGASVANNSAMAASIDQIVAGVNTGGSFPSLEVGCSNATPNGPENTLHTCSHRGPNAPNYPEFDPHAFFTRMFTGASTRQRRQLMKLNQEKKSILDAVLADGAEIANLLGAADKARLSDHLDAIRQIETRLAAMPTMNPTITSGRSAERRRLDRHEVRGAEDRQQGHGADAGGGAGVRTSLATRRSCSRCRPRTSSIVRSAPT